MGLSHDLSRKLVVGKCSSVLDAGASSLLTSKGLRSFNAQSVSDLGFPPGNSGKGMTLSYPGTAPGNSNTRKLASSFISLAVILAGTITTAAIPRRQ
jgi:hypothetical protein